MNITRRKALGIFGGLAATGLLGYSGWIEPKKIAITRNTIAKSNCGATRKVKLVQLTDLHLRHISDFHRSVAQQTIALKPDILLFTGDSIHNRNAVDLLDRFLALFPANIDKFAVLGNWEHWSNADIGHIRQIYLQHKCRLLVNESAVYPVMDKNLLITGLDDYTGGLPSMRDALKGHAPARNHLLLCHSPGYVDRIAPESDSTPINSPLFPEGISIRDFTFDLMLSGHTHGGQIAFFGFAPYLPEGCGRYARGLYTDVNPPLYVSRGIGTSIVPLRFMAVPEISYFEMELG
jgi:uncharacterized protein